MQINENLLLVVAVFILLGILVKAADLVEDGFVYLAKKIGIDEFFIGFVILSAVSSLPELSIAISSNNIVPELSIANIFGASFVLLTLVIGLYVKKFGEIKLRGKFSVQEIFMGVFLILIGILVLLDGVLNFIDGVILILGYFSYLAHIFFQFRKKSQTSAVQLVNVRELLKMFASSIVGIVIILISSGLLVDVVVRIGTSTGVSEALIGIFILAVGTNIPEITFLLRAKTAVKRRLAFGNFLGSATFNIFILGILGLLVQNYQLPTNVYLELSPIIIFLFFALVLLFIFSATSKKITKSEATILFALYFGVIVTELIVVFLLG